MYSARYSGQIVTEFEFSLKGFSKNTQIQNLMKIQPVAADLFHTNSRSPQPLFARSITAKESDVTT
jgi:hypothetical protein